MLNNFFLPKLATVYYIFNATRHVKSLKESYNQKRTNHLETIPQNKLKLIEDKKKKDYVVVTNLKSQPF